jgi:predicted HD superfamily hydrolase involved in NAD metabolism
MFKDLDEYVSIVSLRLKPSRLVHTLGVMNKASELAEIHGCSKEKAMIAGVLHDYAKNLSMEELNEYILKHNIEVDKESNMNINLMHGIVGAYMVREDLAIEDDEILDAISYHTFGRENMSILEKVVFLADAIEDGRDYKGVDEIRDISKISLDKAIIESIENTIEHVFKAGHIVHLNSIRLRNELIEKQRI